MKRASRGGREHAITRILLLMSFAFLLFTACCMVFLYTSVIYLGPQLEEGEPRVGQLYVAMKQLAELPATCNVSFNFGFYLMGSGIFRKGFTDMFKSYFCCMDVGQRAERSRAATNGNNRKNPPYE